LTTESQQRANRANARSSTGPKTAAGKGRSAKNALRHGLNVPISSDSALSALTQAIANRIAGPYADEPMLEDARRIAEAQVDLNRVRNHRRRLIAGLLDDPRYGNLVGGDEKFVAIVEDNATRLSAIDRYERRAIETQILDPHVCHTAVLKSLEGGFDLLN
jgi:hypothetical protein